MGGSTPVRRLCGARRTRGEGTCTRPAGWGTDHAGAGRCKFHGGASLNGRKAALREQAEMACSALGVPVATDPIRALADTLAIANGSVLALRALIADLPGAMSPLGVHPLIVLFGDWTDRLARIGKACADIQLETRWQTLRARDGERLGAAWLRALASEEVGLDEGQRAALRSALAREVRAIPAGIGDDADPFTSAILALPAPAEPALTTDGRPTIRNGDHGR